MIPHMASMMKRTVIDIAMVMIYSLFLNTYNSARYSKVEPQSNIIQQLLVTYCNI